MKRTIALLAGLILLAGCNSQEEAEYGESFEPNLVHAMKYEIKEGFSMKQALEDTDWIVNGMFGTPNEPELPALLVEDEDFADLLTMERLEKSAGPAMGENGLYRKHCASCHGLSGNGRGENSAILDPYPRDYRHGIFKFKSTKRGSKPVREDLARSIRDGIDGTAMKKIPELSEDDIQALVDYVIYLSVRGEVERLLIDDAIFNLDLESGDRIVNWQFAESIATEEARKAVEEQVKAWEEDGEPEDDPRAELAEKLEMYDESMEIAEDILAGVAEEWLGAEDDVVEVPEPPSDIPVTNSHEEFGQMSQGDQAEALAASVKRGQEVFTGKVATCSKCHGKQGKGDGQTNDYDDWTKDWTVRAGLKPDDDEALIPLIARGALPPKNAKPRNFANGVFRGGESAEDLYRRISQGIEGSPMPASTFVPGKYEKDDIWHIINFIRSLEVVEEEPEVPEPAAETA